MSPDNRDWYKLAQKRLVCVFFLTKIMLTCILFMSYVYNYWNSEYFVMLWVPHITQIFVTQILLIKLNFYWTRNILLKADKMSTVASMRQSYLHLLSYVTSLYFCIQLKTLQHSQTWNAETRCLQMNWF